MQLVQLPVRSQSGAPSRRLVLPFCFALLLAALCAPAAQAGFIGDYPLSDFTLIGDGSVVLIDGGSKLRFTGPNTGSGLAGSTDLVAVAKTTGLIQFDFLYSALDTWDPTDPTATPYDYAGYLVGSAFTKLADQNGQTGGASFAVTAGETFGFRIVTEDNIGEPGILTIFDSDTPGAAIPEPGTWTLLAAAGAAALASPRLRRALIRNKEKHS